MQQSSEAASQSQSGKGGHGASAGKTLRPGGPARAALGSEPASSSRMMISNLANAEKVLRTRSFFVGRVKITGDQYTMVECEDSGYECDIYAHRKTIKPGGLTKDDTVAFEIHESQQGKPQVSAPVWRHVGILDPEAPLEFGEYLGQVGKVYGNATVKCPTVLENHGQSAQIHKDVLRRCELEEGDVIAFSVESSSSGVPWVSAPCWKCVSSNGFIEQWSTADPESFATDQGEAMDDVDAALAEAASAYEEQAGAGGYYETENGYAGAKRARLSP